MAKAIKEPSKKLAKHMVKNKNVKLSLVTIGPDNIDEHLILCRSNRSRSRRHINTYVRLIKQGNFRDGGFIFADGKGYYHDAQHRLFALKITGHTAKFWVISGLDAEDLNMTVDAGKKRTNAARLTAMGIKRSSLIVASIDEALDTVENWKKSAEMLMPDEVFAYLKANPELHVLAENWATSGIKDIKLSYLVAFQHLFTKVDTEKADQFFNGIMNRQLVKPGHPLHAFFQMLKSEMVLTSKEGEVNKFTRNGLIIAWNAFLKGEQLDHITPTARRITLEGTALTEGPSLTDENGADLFDSDEEPGDIEAEVEVEENA